MGAENVVRISQPGTEDPLFSGWNLGTPLTYIGWLNRLRDEYNTGLWWGKITVMGVPGYLKHESGFLNVPSLAQLIFKLRSSGGK